MNSSKLRKQIIETAIAFNTSGLSVGTSGNLSVRTSQGYLITPTGIAYHQLKEIDIVEMDMQGNITFCNNALLNLLGWQRAQLLGKHWIETLVANQFKDACSEFFEQAIQRRKDTTTHESWLQDRLKREYLIRWHDTFLTNSEGEDVGLIFIGEDITQYRENEMRVRHLSEAVEQSPASVVLTDKEGLIEYVNPKFESLTGYSLEEVKGLTPRILKSGETSDEEYSNLWRKVKQGKTWRGIFHNRKKSGELYWE